MPPGTELRRRSRRTRRRLAIAVRLVLRAARDPAQSATRRLGSPVRSARRAARAVVRAVAAAAEAQAGTAMRALEPQPTSWELSSIGWNAPWGVGSDRVEVPAGYLARALAEARKNGEQVAVIVVDAGGLPPVLHEMTARLVHGRLRRRDFVAVEGGALVLVRRARFAARDAEALAAQVAGLLTPESAAPPAWGAATYPGGPAFPQALLGGARSAMEEARDLRRARAA